MSMSSQPVETVSREPQAPEKHLRGNMNVADVMFTVLAYNGPATGLIGFIPVAILMGNGLGTPALFLAAGLLVLLIATGLMKISSTLKRPGGFYAFITAGLGKEVGLAAGFGALITYFAGGLGVYALGGIALSDIIVHLFNGPEIPWPAGGLILLAVVSLLGYFNISFSAKVLTIFLGLEMVLILIYCGAVLAQGGAHGISLEGFNATNIFSGSLAVGGLYAIGVFGGFEATVIFREEVKNPERTIPKATYGVVAAIALTYALSAFCFINAYGGDVVMSIVTNDVGTSATASIKEYVGDFAYSAALMLLFTSCFALCLAAHNILARYIFNLAADGVMPAKIGISHPRYDSPHRASILVSSASLVVLIVLIVAQVPKTGLYGYIAGIYSYGMLIMMSLVSLAIAVFLLQKFKGHKLHAVGMFFAFAVMAVTLVFASFNFDLLSGMTGALGVTVLVLIWLFILSGTVLAVRLKRTKPDVYAKIGRQ